jgi:hypothetical protein
MADDKAKLAFKMLWDAVGAATHGNNVQQGTPEWNILESITSTLKDIVTDVYKEE